MAANNGELLLSANIIRAHSRFAVDSNARKFNLNTYNKYNMYKAYIKYFMRPESLNLGTSSNY